jgi:hypothetical protein
VLVDLAPFENSANRPLVAGVSKNVCHRIGANLKQDARLSPASDLYEYSTE